MTMERQTKARNTMRMQVPVCGTTIYSVFTSVAVRFNIYVVNRGTMRKLVCLFV